VLNDDEEYEEAFKLGAAGVMTDFPTKLRDFLDNHPEYMKD
jgi:glycerophosphoryl diester phosphodiesterase